MNLSTNGPCSSIHKHSLRHLPNRIPPLSLKYSRRRQFHDYFVTHLPSSSLHPDSRSRAGPSHKLPRDQSTPHADGGTGSRSPASLAQSTHSVRAAQSPTGVSREMTVVRIPLKSAKHHFGASCSRGTRPYNEDTYQAGTIELPAFAKKGPVSIRSKYSDKDDTKEKEAEAADSASGDPQVFYFAVFDGHGGDKCSLFLRERLHTYLEKSAMSYGLDSTLISSQERDRRKEKRIAEHTDQTNTESSSTSKDPESISFNLVESWRDTVGGYFRRFKPEFFSAASGGMGKILFPSILRESRLQPDETCTPFSLSEGEQKSATSPPTIDKVLTHSFLRADLDFITTPQDKLPESISSSQTSFGDDEPLGRHDHHSTPAPFLGGSTASLALISTPTPIPFWHPSTPFTLLTAQIGDTRILLSSVATGAAVPATPIHHPSSPGEAARLRRYAAAFATDSFGEERFGGGLANTRAFGDRKAKRLGVSAEPDLTLLHAKPGEYAFLVLISDGITASLSDQEIVDIVKESRTPEEGARTLTSLAEELAQGETGEGDNGTALVVRLGGWERRGEGGGGGMGTRENREWRLRGVREGGRRQT